LSHRRRRIPPLRGRGCFQQVIARRPRPLDPILRIFPESAYAGVAVLLMFFFNAGASREEGTSRRCKHATHGSDEGVTARRQTAVTLSFCASGWGAGLLLAPAPHERPGSAGSASSFLPSWTKSTAKLKRRRISRPLHARASQTWGKCTAAESRPEIRSTCCAREARPVESHPDLAQW